MAGKNLQIKGYTAQYYVSRLINLEWVKRGAGVHVIFSGFLQPRRWWRQRAGNSVCGAASGWPMVSDSGEQGPSKCARRSHRLRRFGRESRYFSAPVTMVTFGSEQYVWYSDGPKSHADPDNPPLQHRFQRVTAHRSRCRKLLLRCYVERLKVSSTKPKTVRNDCENGINRIFSSGPWLLSCGLPITQLQLLVCGFLLFRLCRPCRSEGYHVSSGASHFARFSQRPCRTFVANLF